MSESETPKKGIASISLRKETITQTTLTPTRPRRMERVQFPDPPLGNGGPPPTIENIQLLLDHYGVTVRDNLIKKRTEVTIPGVTKIADNYDNNAITHICSFAARHGIATGMVPSVIEAIAEKHPFNPVALWIEDKPWDGEDRLPLICDTLITRDGYPVGLKDILITKWLLSAVAAALVPEGFRARGVLTLQGPQGIGKTSWCRQLVPDPALREIALKLDHHLDGGNKDSIIGAITHWIVEIGELDSSFKRDVARLKGFLTNDRDVVRLPYARKAAEYGRRTVFMATVNEANFLVDSTGNSRFWTLPVVTIDYEHNIDMQQVFAQLAVRLRAGDQWWLTPDEECELAFRNERHRAISVVEELLNEIVDWERDDLEYCEKVNTTSLLKRAGIDNPTNPQMKECAALLRSRFGDPSRIQGVMKWRVPLKPGQFEERHSGGAPARLEKDKFD